MTAMLDLGPAAQRLADLLGAIPDEQLTAPTPCAKYTLGDLLDHVDGLSHAFLIAARKTPLSEGSQPPSPTPPGSARTGAPASPSSSPPSPRPGVTRPPGKG